MQLQIRELLHSLGPDTAERIAAPPALPSLAAQGLRYVGLSDAGPGYRMHRPAPRYGHLLATRSGRGRVFVDGSWVECGEGFAYVSPPGAPSAFEALPNGGERWQFAWVFTDDRETAGVGAAGLEFGFSRSVLVPADAEPLSAAIDGIYREGVGMADRLLLDDWARLVRAYAARIACPSTTAPVSPIDPLARLWAEVDARPGADWTLARLCTLSHRSGESLRRLCLRHHGRSPMEQVTHLRMRRADTLLRSTSMKLVVIAPMVGYENAFAFSTAFRRWCGVSPRERRAAANSDKNENYVKPTSYFL